MNKFTWFFLGMISVIATAAFISFASAGWWADVFGKGNAQLGPSIQKADSSINAHQCNADNVCEMREISATSHAFIGGNLGVNGEVKMGRYGETFAFSIVNGEPTINLHSVTIKGKEISTVEGSGADLVLSSTSNNGAVNVINKFNLKASRGGNDYTEFDSYNGILRIHPSSGLVKIAGDLSVSNLQVGTGNSYVCVDSGGKLFGSKTPCA